MAYLDFKDFQRIKKFWCFWILGLSCRFSLKRRKYRKIVNVVKVQSTLSLNGWLISIMSDWWLNKALLIFHYTNTAQKNEEILNGKLRLSCSERVKKAYQIPRRIKSTIQCFVNKLFTGYEATFYKSLYLLNGKNIT